MRSTTTSRRRSCQTIALCLMRILAQARAQAQSLRRRHGRRSATTFPSSPARELVRVPYNLQDARLHMCMCIFLRIQGTWISAVPFSERAHSLSGDAQVFSFSFPFRKYKASAWLCRLSLIDYLHAVAGDIFSPTRFPQCPLPASLFSSSRAQSFECMFLSVIVNACLV